MCPVAGHSYVPVAGSLPSLSRRGGSVAPRLRVANPDVESEVATGKEFGKKSNVLPVSSARRALEEEVQRLLEQEKSRYGSKSVENLQLVTSKDHLKSLVFSKEHVATLVAFGSTGCHACRSMESKLVGLAEQNPDIMFAKVNTASPGMAEIAEGLGVPKLPYFLMYNGTERELVASFTANLSTIDVLRAEISNVKECSGPGCDL